MITSDHVMRIVFGAIPSILTPVFLVPLCLSPAMWDASPFAAILMAVMITVMGLGMLYSVLFEA